MLRGDFAPASFVLMTATELANKVPCRLSDSISCHVECKTGLHHLAKGCLSAFWERVSLSLPSALLAPA